MKKSLLCVMFLFLTFCFGCKLGDVDSLLYSGVNQTTAWGETWTIYNNGNIDVGYTNYDAAFGIYPSGGSSGWVDHNGNDFFQTNDGKGKVFKMEWKGVNPQGSGSETSAYWFFFVSPQHETKSFDSSGYTKLKYRLKLNLKDGNTTVYIKALTKDNNDAGSKTYSHTTTQGVWFDDEIQISTSAVTYSLAATFISIGMQKTNTTDGGELYIDNIRLEK